MKQARNRRRRSREPQEPPSDAGTPPTPHSSSPTTLRPSSPMGRPTATQPKLILPVPIYTPVDHTKKSHARKQPAGHIPRPRNAFILFRCNFVDQDKIPSSVERDHRNISRIVGSIWRRMSDAEKEPWVRMADDEKRAHFLAYPGYRFSRALTSTSVARPMDTRRRRDDDTASSRGSSSPNSPESFPHSAGNPSRISVPSQDVRRPASCPLGADTPAVGSQTPDPFLEPITTREELARRPSRVMLSESARYDDSRSGLDDLLALGGYNMRYADDRSQYSSGEDIQRHQFDVQSHGPRLNALRIPMPDMDHPSELDSVDTWDDWHATQRQKSISPPRKEATQDSLEYSSIIMADSIDLDLSPTLPPLPMPHTPERLDDEYYPAPASPIERNSFYSPRSGTWKLPLPVVSFNSGTGTTFTSSGHIDNGLSFADNLIDEELRYPDAEELSRRTRASLSWSGDSPASSGSSDQVDERQLYYRESQAEFRGSWRSSLR